MRVGYVAAMTALCSAMATSAQRKPVRPPPIVQMPSFPEENYGDWKVAAFGHTLVMATTRNQSGSVFGVFCSKGSCIIFFNPSITCENGEKYPVLINSPAGAANQTLTCEKVDTAYLMELSNDSSVRDAMTIGGTLGIAFPMKSGEFNVSRFSMIGAARAYSRAAQLTQPTSTPNSTVPADKTY